VVNTKCNCENDEPGSRSGYDERNKKVSTVNGDKKFATPMMTFQALPAVRSPMVTSPTSVAGYRRR
jgi:hypothetical protein